MSDGNVVAVPAMKMPAFVMLIGILCIIAGAVTFVTGIVGPNPLRAWQAYYVNFLYWTGLSFGAVLFVAVLNMTDAQWGRPLKRLSESFGAFLPIVLLLFSVLWFGRMELFPWMSVSPITSRRVWLNSHFLFARNGAGILLFSLIALAMIRFSLKGDYHWHRRPAGVATDNDLEGPWALCWQRQRILSPALGIVFAFVLSLMGFDLIMSLDPHWYSALLGGYFFIGSFYSGLAAICLLALIVANGDALKDRLMPRHFHDMGKLILAFCLFTGYLFYTQFLVIWYGNLPVETRYVILRVKLTPWEPISWVVLFMVFVVPFVVLLNRRIKTKRVPMIVVSLVIMVGMWLERFILVAPSLWKQQGVPLGFTEILITAGYAGIMVLCVGLFLKRVPVLPISDPLYRKSVQMGKERLAP